MAGGAGGGTQGGSAPRLADLPAYRRHAEWAIAAATALELGVAEALAEAGVTSADALAARLSLDPRGVRILLGALEALGVARLDPEGWRLTGAGRARLVDGDAPDHQARSLRHWLQGIRRWTAELPEAVRRGAPAGGAGPGTGAPDPEALERFMAAMDDKSPDLVERVAAACLTRVPGAARALDVGGGPGTFSRALAARGVRVTLLDRPEVVELVGWRYGLAGHPSIELAGGDFLADLPSGPFDIVLLANITHIYPAPTNAELVRRAAARLAPGGALAILDFVRGLSPFASLFAITMLLNTERGDTYGTGEYAAWLEAAGLRRTRIERVDADAHLLTAVQERSEGGRLGRAGGGSGAEAKESG